MKKPTPEQVIAYVNENMTLRDGVFYWKKKPHRNAPVKIGNEAGSKRATGYVTFTIFDYRFLRSHIVWAVTHGYWPDGKIFHLNGDKMDDRLENLELVKWIDIPKARKLTDAPKDIPEGITRQARRGVWRVDIAGRHIGSYTDIRQALQAHRQATGA